MKQKEETKALKQAQSTAAELQDKFDAQKAVITQLTIQLGE